MKPTRIALLVTALIFGAGVYAGYRSAKSRTPEAVPETSADSAGTERMIAEALEAAPQAAPQPVDSVQIKTGWRDDVPGIDLAAMTKEKQELFLRHANSQMCSCGCGYTLAACRKFDTTCPVSGPRVEALRDSIEQGLITSARGLRERLTVRERPD
jgi:hypothetical protein